jgi:thiamine-phosphate pyrophosphorylase
VSLPDPPLLLITDRKQAVRPLPEMLEAAFAAGCRWASLREKDLPVAEQIAMAQSLLPLARRYGARLTLHGKAATAKAAGTDGVHLSAGSNSAAARALLGPQALIGISIHTLDEAAKLDAAILDYAIAGPVFPTASKPGFGPILGEEGLAGIIQAAVIPVLAIGGISAISTARMTARGAAGVAVMGAIMRAADPAKAVLGLLQYLRSTNTATPISA